MEETNNPMKPISIRDIFMEKNPRMAKMIPGFVYRYISRIMHISEVNEIIEKYGHLEGIDFVHGMIEYFNVKPTVVGLDRLPASGRFIFASNHPLGGFDAMIIMSQVDKCFGRLKFLVNDVLMEIKPLRSLFVPLNKHGALDRKIINDIENEYAGDAQILIFPSGFASRKMRGKIMDFEWKKHFIAKAIEYKRDVVPVYVTGRNSNFFYWLANFRTAIKVKWNLEMFFLPDETFKHRNQSFTVYFGEPIPWQTFDKTERLEHWAEKVKHMVYNLPKLSEAND